MSCSDVKIKKLSLAYFRGARPLIELDLGSDCRSAAIFGHNGEGKSTFAQAIEWFYKEKVAALSGEGIDKEDIVNLAATDADQTSVEVVFNKKALRIPGTRTQLLTVHFAFRRWFNFPEYSSGKLF